MFERRHWLTRVFRRSNGAVNSTRYIPGDCSDAGICGVTFSININPVEHCLHYAAKRQLVPMRNYTRKMQVDEERFDQMPSQRAFFVFCGV